MINYELHTLKKHVSAKEWEIGSVFEDRELALHEAKILITAIAMRDLCDCGGS